MSGQCYKGAFDLLLQHENAVLVHGYPRLTCDGELHGRKFGHAWIEVEIHGQTFCIDHLFPDRVVHQRVYYAVGRINEKECRKYPRRAAMRKAYKTERYGPWGPQPPDVLFADDEAQICAS